MLLGSLLMVLTACSPANTSSAPTGTPTVGGSAGTTAPSPPAVGGELSRATSEVASPAPAAVASCGPIRRPPLQSGSHLIGDQQAPVPYSSQPPTSGWHASGHVAIGVRGADDALTEPQQVSVLEAGAVVVSHRGLSERDERRLARRVRRRYEGRVAVTPYAELGAGRVAFTSWGVLQRCDGVDLAALDAFVDRFGPERRVGTGH